ncbi:MAG: Fur family transcriptional regulator [Phycisphaerales bacterium]
MDRRTAQRQAIREVFESAARPLGPAEVMNLARQLPGAGGVGQATVYRTIKALLAEGWLKAVDVPGEPQRYERSGLAHHHHFRCRVCDRVFDLEGCALDGMHVHLPRGFRMESHEIWIYGQCKNCRAA